MVSEVIGSKISENSIVLDAHLINSFRTCEQKFQFIEEQHVFPKRKKSAPAFGIAMHEGIATYRIAKMANNTLEQAMLLGMASLKAAYQKHMPPESTGEVVVDERRSLDNALRIFEGYCKHYERHNLTFRHVEVPFAMLIGSIDSPFTKSKREVVYTGIIDAVLDMGGYTYVNDLKSTAWNITQQWLEVFRMSQAQLGYVVACKELLGLEVNSALIHAMWIQKEAKGPRSKPLDEYFQTFPCSWTKEQIEEWHGNTLHTAQKIEVARAEGKWQMDWGSSCGMYGGCDYFSVCSAAPGIRKLIISNDFEKAIWSPLEDERLTKLES